MKLREKAGHKKKKKIAHNKTLANETGGGAGGRDASVQY